MAATANNFEVQEFETEALSDEEVSDAHHKLLNAVSKLYKKQRIEAPKHREPAQEISDFNLSSGIEGKSNNLTVNANELLSALKERATHRQITKKVKSGLKKTKKLPKPLEKLEEQKIARSVGYDNVKTQLNKWSSIVERNRLASQLIFPLESAKKINNTTTYKFLTTFKEPTELEKEMSKVLDKSETAKEEKKEEEQLSKLSIEEMIERRNMTARMRARESYRISKAIRQNKIKSKKYHRILKKEKIKQELKDFEKLQKTDPEAALEKLEQIERARAEERISLRHRNTGKWARSKAIRAKYDTEARIQLSEQLAKSRDLTRKLKENINSSSENESEDENEEDESNKNTHFKKVNENGTSDNPWVSEYDQFISGFSKFDEAEDVLKAHAADSIKKIQSNLNLDDHIDEDIEDNEKEAKKFEFKKSARLHDIDAALIEIADEGISSGLNDLSVLKEKLNLSESKTEKEPQIDPNKLITVKPQKLSSELPDLDENGDDSDDEEKEKHLNLMEAFAEDDIVDQFRQEKKDEEKTSKPKAIDLTLPGWGSWAGTGVEEKKKSRRKKRRFIVRFPRVPRKDNKKPNVIINEDPVPKLREQLVNELPYPFTSVKDFEASIRAPIGKNWVTEKGFKKLTAPPVITKMGTIIEPIDSSMLNAKPKKRLNNSKPNVNLKKKKMD